MIRASLISLLLTAPTVALAQEQADTQADVFVALAVDRSALATGFGVAQTPADAQVEALKACSEIAASCKLRYTRSNTCVAVAADYGSGSWGVHRGKTVALATENALNHCSTKFNNDAPCQLVAVRCATTEMENS
jgi:hypothetical protein